MTNLPPYGALSPTQRAQAEQMQQHAATLGVHQPQAGQQVQVTLPSAGAEPVPFESALPGSTIAVFAPGFNWGEQCRVIHLDPEFGPTSQPALHLVDSAGERRLLMSTDPKARIEIVVSAEQLGIEQIPEGAIRARNRPVDVSALQWKGGAGEAAKFILWGARHALIRYEEDTDTSDEFLTITKLDKSAEEQMRPGDWLVKNPDTGFTVVSEADFPRLYEEVALFA